MTCLIPKIKHRELGKNQETKEYVPNDEIRQTSEKELNEMEINNLPNKEFK